MAVKTDQQAIETRQRFIEAWNKTMVDIWQEQITLLGVVDTKQLLQSPIALPVRADGRFYEITFSHEFLEYGLWQDYGTGREVPLRNKGDIGRVKVRERRQWFSKKYYSSVLKLRDFMADSIGQEFCGIFTEMFNDGLFKSMTDYYRRNKRIL
ncbi:MAG: hypothetical protein IJ352_06675 [Muribaculaceae bacterium]|nr:hypothetical protein [Muribaculaceae bacterium]